MQINRNGLKLMAVAAMVIDHLAWTFFALGTPAGEAMHFIGRLTAPIMAFFIAEGYQHTRDVKKYLRRLGFFALISWIPYDLFEYGKVVPFSSVITNLFLGLLAICVWDRSRWSKFKRIGVSVLLVGVSVLGDWPFFIVLWCLSFFIFREDNGKKWAAYCMIAGASVLLSGFDFIGIWKPMYALGVFAVPPIIQFLYNGQAGKQNAFFKWFFYVFYPGHLLLLYFVKLWIL